MNKNVNAMTENELREKAQELRKIVESGQANIHQATELQMLENMLHTFDKAKRRSWWR